MSLKIPLNGSRNQFLSNKKPIFKLKKLKEILNNTGQPKATKHFSSADITLNKKKKKKHKNAVSKEHSSNSNYAQPSKITDKQTSTHLSSTSDERCEKRKNNKSNRSSKTKTKISEMQINCVRPKSAETGLDRTDASKVKRRKDIESEAKQRLRAASFRILNEKMYTTRGSDSWKFFQEEEPDSYAIYHEGYRQQVKKWPVDPLDLIIQSIQKMHLKRSRVVADLGCGEARLAQLLGHSRTVHSFDLKALNEHVVECDIAQLPLKDGTVDVVVFCLSLMGTNLRDYLYSAARILKIGGVMKIAEVESRFENTKEFVTNLKRFGFKLIKEDTSNNLFILMDFVKRKDPAKKCKLPELTLAPCVYKKR